MHGIPAFEDLVVAQFPKLPSHYNRRFCEEFQAVYVARPYKSFWQWQRRVPAEVYRSPALYCKGALKQQVINVLLNPGRTHDTECHLEHLGSFFVALSWC